jgi:hypothetical protein
MHHFTKRKRCLITLVFGNVSASQATALQLLSHDARLAQLGELGALQVHAAHRLHLDGPADGEHVTRLGDVAPERGLHLAG